MFIKQARILRLALQGTWIYSESMTTLSNIALSGMRAAQTALDTSAHNIANLGTEGFHRQQVVQQEAPGGSGQLMDVMTSPTGATFCESQKELMEALTAMPNGSNTSTERRG